jgi:hypothetical protein
MSDHVILTTGAGFPAAPDESWSEDLRTSECGNSDIASRSGILPSADGGRSLFACCIAIVQSARRQSRHQCGAQRRRILNELHRVLSFPRARGNALPGVLRRLEFESEETQSVEDCIPTRSVGTRLTAFVLTCCIAQRWRLAKRFKSSWEPICAGGSVCSGRPRQRARNP